MPSISLSSSSSSSSSSLLIRSKKVPIIHSGFTVSAAAGAPTTTTKAHVTTNHQRPMNAVQHHRSVEIWTTTCIVTNFGRSQLSDSQQLQQHDSNDIYPPRWTLINPCNSGLTGCKAFPYFPKGGPVPEQKIESATHRDWQPLGYVTQWGGMEVGTGMLYPISVVDGLVHIFGGSKLQSELYWQRQTHRWHTFWSKDRAMNVNEPCPVGHAIVTSAGDGPLTNQYDHIVHTTPPFYRYNTHPTYSSEMLLSKCYESALHIATLIPSTERMTNVVALPLLGSGARGFPVDIACQVAAASIVTWLLKSSSDNASNEATRHTIQRHTYRRNMDDDVNENNIPPQTTPTGAIIENTSSHSPHQSHQRVLFGLLDCVVAEELAVQISKQILESSKND